MHPATLLAFQDEMTKIAVTFKPGITMPIPTLKKAVQGAGHAAAGAATGVMRGGVHPAGAAAGLRSAAEGMAKKVPWKKVGIGAGASLAGGEVEHLRNKKKEQAHAPGNNAVVRQ